MSTKEVNFDGLVGPTHNYAGLSYGNIASKSNEGNISRPKEAVLQGLEKMRALNNLGMVQGILPPQERPNIKLLKQFGFSGSEQRIIEKAAKTDPMLLAIATSASCMWTANAATVSPSADTVDGKTHFTVANLNSLAHRAQEYTETESSLKAIFRNTDQFSVHSAIPGGNGFGDEGAANHTRLCENYGDTGVEVFVYGRSALDKSKPEPTKYPGRQTLEASKVVARRHELKSGVALFVQQNPEVINQGVFHNDVISVGNRNVLFYHEQAFLDTQAHLEEIDAHIKNFCPIKVLTKNVSVEDAVKSYLFNTQLISPNDKEMHIIAPSECEENSRVKAEIERVISDSSNPISKVHYFNLRESMRNGGGPACLRLRVALTEDEITGVNPNCIFTDELFERLSSWANKNYRNQIKPDDIRDPNLLIECRTALDELTQILNLGSIYDFQR